MPSSLVVVGLVLAWLVVLVPMIVRKRQEVTRTADSTLSARVVRSGAEDEEFAEYEADEEAAMNDTGRVEEDFRHDVEDDDVEEEFADDLAEDGHGAADDYADDAMSDEFAYRRPDYAPDYDYGRRYRPGRGGFDPEAAAVIARAKYAFRQRVVLAMLIGAVATAVVAAVVFPILWWAHGAIDLTLVTYLGYLRRQVRIETEIRERRLARMNRARRAAARPRPADVEPAEYAEETHYAPDPEPEVDPTLRERVADGPPTPPPPVHPRGAVVVDIDDEDPAFDELDEPGSLPYRRAVGE